MSALGEMQKIASSSCSAIDSGILQLRGRQLGQIDGGWIIRLGHLSSACSFDFDCLALHRLFARTRFPVLSHAPKHRRSDISRAARSHTVVNLI